MTMRIYVADLAAYNAGYLHGVWIDVVDDVPRMQEQVNAMLAKSPEPNVTRARYHCAECDRTYYETYGFTRQLPESVQCDECGGDLPMTGEPFPSAEEYAIHDSEGLGNLGEYAGLQEVARRASIVDVADDNGIPLAVLLAFADDYMSGDWDSDDLEREVDDRYRGTFDSWRDMAQEFMEETNDMSELPEWVRGHIDWDSIARDFEVSGDLTAYRDGEFGDLFFFWAL